MRIIHKLTLSTCLLAALICVVGLYAVSVGRWALQESIEDDSSRLAAEVLDEINRSFQVRVDDWRVYSSGALVQRTAQASNRQFQALPDKEAYLKQQDSDWKNAPQDEPTSLMQDLTSNDLAVDLRRKVDGVTKCYGCKVYGEVFVTNRYGANVAQTTRTSDYRQDDETWWQETMKNSPYLGQLSYDQSSGVYSTDICVRVDDPAGEPLGVIKAVLNVESMIALLEARASGSDPLGPQADYRDEFVLLDSQQRIIHSTRDPTIGLWSKRSYPHRFTERPIVEGTLTFHREDKEHGQILASCAFSNKGLGWTLVVENRAADVFAPVRRLRNNILAMSLGIAVCSMALGVTLSLSFSRRLARLKDAATELGAGNLQARIEDRSTDEIGRLGECFNELASSLQQSRQALADQMSALESNNRVLERLNNEREREIAQRRRTEEDLRGSQQTTRAILSSMPVGVAVVGHDRRVRHLNKAALALMGYDSEEEIVGHSCRACFHPTQAGKCPVLDLKQSVDNSEQTLFTKDGKEVPVLKTVIPVRLGQEDVLLETFVDISDRKRAEQKLQQHLVELEEANRRLGILVSNSTEREKQMVRLKQEVNGLLEQIGQTPKYVAPSQIAEAGLQATAADGD